MSSLLLTALIFTLLLTSSTAQTNPGGSYDITAEKGWDNFVKEASKGTGGTPINMDDFVTRVNNNINSGAEEASDPDLMAELKSLDDRKGLVNDPSAAAATSNPSVETEPPSALLDDIETAKMIAATNGGSLAPAANGAFSVKAVGLVCGMLPLFAAVLFYDSVIG